MHLFGTKARKDKDLRNKVLKYQLGQWIGDYLISKIEASKVTLMKGGGGSRIKTETFRGLTVVSRQCAPAVVRSPNRAPRTTPRPQ